MKTLRAVIALLACASLPKPARADLLPPTVVGEVTPLPDGLYRYTYTVTNTVPDTPGFWITDPATGERSRYVPGLSSLGGFKLMIFGFSPDFMNFTPSEYFGHSYPPGSYPAWDTGGFGGPGYAQSEQFSFVSAHAPDVVPWEARADFPTDDVVFLDGDTVGPGPQLAPQPGALTLLLSGLLGALTYQAWGLRGRQNPRFLPCP